MATYLDQINHYFKLKDSYYDKLNQEKQKLINNQELTSKEKRQKFQQYKKKCINCKQLGGTHFTQTNNQYKAYCGHTSKPCDLNITIDRQQKSLIDEKLLEYIGIINDIKKQIILTKLNYVFNYIPEDESIVKFNELKTNLNDLTDNYNSLFTQYINIIHNIDKNDEISAKLINREELITEIKTRITLFKSTNNIQYIKECVELFVKDLTILNKDLRELQYRVITVEKDEKNEQKKTHILSYLIKDVYTFKQLEIDISE